MSRWLSHFPINSLDRGEGNRNTGAIDSCPPIVTTAYDILYARYELTDWGRELKPIIISLGSWAIRSPSFPRDAPVSTDSVILALSTFFDAAGVSASGRYAVVFRLKAPLGAFPYLLSQTTYQAIIQPAAIAAKPGTWVESGMIGTGAYKLKSYTEKRGADLVRHATYWGGRPALDGVKVTLPEGWFLVRGSNTEPIIRIVAESRSESQAREIVSRIYDRVANCIN